MASAPSVCVQIRPQRASANAPQISEEEVPPGYKGMQFTAKCASFACLDPALFGFKRPSLSLKKESVLRRQIVSSLLEGNSTSCLRIAQRALVSDLEIHTHTPGPNRIVGGGGAMTNPPSQQSRSFVRSPLINGLWHFVNFFLTLC